VQKGNHALRDGLDIALFKLLSSGKVDEEWIKVTGAGMLVKIPAQP